jgi:hypothetical protein
MLPLGVQLTFFVGPTVPVPPPPFLLEALDSVTVRQSDDARGGFEITFQAGRSGLADLLGSPVLTTPLLQPYNRVLLVVTINAVPHVLMDGVITRRDHQPSNRPGASTLKVIGEDLSVLMDSEEKAIEHPAQPDMVIALKIIASYAQYGLIPVVIPPLSSVPPLPTERIPVQRATDLHHLLTMASRHGYVFRVSPGPAPFTSTAYWGPPQRVGVPQPALTLDMGSATNLERLDFSEAPLQASIVEGKVQDRTTNSTMPVMAMASTQVPLSLLPSWVAHLPKLRKSMPEATTNLSAVEALARAQGQMERSLDTITATGELDGVRYGGVLRAPGLVGVRGAGFLFDGFYRVRSVSHTLRRGGYKQQFELSRDGVGSTTPVVPP